MPTDPKAQICSNYPWITRRYRLPLEKCGHCGVVILARDICPECGESIVIEGENVNQALKESRPVRLTKGSEIMICSPSYGKERGG